MLAGGEWKRGKGKLPFQREKNRNFLDLQSILLESSESLNTSPSNMLPSDVSGAMSGKVPYLASSTPCRRVFRWDVDPKCWPNY
jgi:hypothetical protein